MDKTYIRDLAYARSEKAKAYTALKELEMEFQKSPEYQKLANALEECSVAENEADKAFRLEAISDTAILNRDGSEPYSIKYMRTVTIPDENNAITWCRTNFTPALALNKKVFEAAVKAGTIPTDVAYQMETPKVFIDSDLSKYLEE